MTTSHPLRVCAILLLFFSSAVSAYNCDNLNSFVYGGGMQQGVTYQSNDGAYECSTNWCMWVEPGGNNNYWNQAWDFQGACDNQQPLNTPPVVTMGNVDDQLVGESQTFTASASDVDGNIVSWELIIYWDTLDGWQSPTVIDSGTGNMLGSVQLSGTWSTQNVYEYVAVANVTDSDGETTTASARFVVAEEVEPKLSMSLPSSSAMLVDSFRSVTVSVWHPSERPSPPRVEIITAGAISGEGTSSTSSSSGGGGGAQIGYAFQPRTDADITVRAYHTEYGLEKTAFIEVLPADGLPELNIDAPETANAGDSVNFTVSAKDVDGLADVSVTLNSLALSADSTTYLGGDSASNAYGVEMSYTWIAQAGTNLLQLVATDNADNTVDALVEIEVTGEEEPPPPPSGCAAEGVDMEEVNAYPNWPHNDWKGDPNNANTGDLMSHEGSVYHANWWTTTTPGSDNSWTWVCDI